MRKHCNLISRKQKWNTDILRVKNTYKAVDNTDEKFDIGGGTVDKIILKHGLYRCQQVRYFHDLITIGICVCLEPTMCAGYELCYPQQLANSMRAMIEKLNVY